MAAQVTCKVDQELRFEAFYNMDSVLNVDLIVYDDEVPTTLLRADIESATFAWHAAQETQAIWSATKLDGNTETNVRVKVSDEVSNTVLHESLVSGHEKTDFTLVKITIDVQAD